MKSDNDIVIENSREIEKLLIQKFQTKGSGLVEQLKSIDESKIPRTLDYVIRRIAHTRNAVVHRGIKLSNKSDFIKMADSVIFDLNTIPSIEKKKQKNIKKKDVKKQSPTKKVAIKKIQNTPKPVQYPPDFDPHVVDLKNMGTFGSDRYNKP